MFAAYSRRVDRRIFTKINAWLAGRNDRTDPNELRRFAEFCGRSTAEEFFRPPVYPRLELERSSCRPLRYEFRFASPLPSGYPENDVVHGELHVRHELSAPAAVVLSGWLVSGGDFERLADWVGRCGRNLWVMDMPYHSRRTPAGTRPGELALTADLVRTLKGIRQIAVETRVLAAALAQLGVQDTALVGFSLGGWVGALLARLENSISTMVLATPVLRPAGLLFSSPYFAFMRQGIEGDAARQAFARAGHLFLPSQARPALPPQRIHLIGAHEDTIATPASLKKLALRWGCRSAILPGGHVTLYFTPRFWRRIFACLGSTPGSSTA